MTSCSKGRAIGLSNAWHSRRYALMNAPSTAPVESFTRVDVGGRAVSRLPESVDIDDAHPKAVVGAGTGEPGSVIERLNHSTVEEGGLVVANDMRRVGHPGDRLPDKAEVRFWFRGTELARCPQTLVTDGFTNGTVHYTTFASFGTCAARLRSDVSELVRSWWRDPVRRCDARMVVSDPPRIAPTGTTPKPGPSTQLSSDAREVSVDAG